jgi:hypothetical protein
MIGHFWHFGRQDFGVLSAYRHRSRQLSPRDRRVDQHFTQMMMYVIQPIIYLSVFIKFPFFNIVNSVFPLRAIDAVARGAVILAGALFVAVTLFELMKVNRSIPKLVYYTIMLFHPLFLYFGGLGLTPYWYLGYLWSHWLIATTLAARVHMGFQVKQGVSFKRAVITHALAIGWVTLVVWGLTRPLAEFALLNKDFVDAREILRTLPPEKMTIMGLFFGFILGEQLVHYYCDRWLFRFKDADVRAAVAAHLG